MCLASEAQVCNQLANGTRSTGHLQNSKREGEKNVPASRFELKSPAIPSTASPLRLVTTIQQFEPCSISANTMGSGHANLNSVSVTENQCLLVKPYHCTMPADVGQLFLHDDYVWKGKGWESGTKVKVQVKVEETVVSRNNIIGCRRQKCDDKTLQVHLGRLEASLGKSI